MSKTFLFPTIQFSVSTVSKAKQFYFKRIQFFTSTQFSSIWSIVGPYQMLSLRSEWLGSDGNERVLRIPLSSSVTGTSLSDCLVTYPGHSLGGCPTHIQSNSWGTLQPQPTGQGPFEWSTQWDVFTQKE